MSDDRRRGTPAGGGGAARRWGAPVALTAAVLASYGQLALGRPLTGYDVVTYTLPYRVQVADALRSLRLPQWDALRFAGAPLLANPQAAVLYPPHWLLLSLPADRAHSVALVVHAGIAAAGAYVFARRALRVSPAAAGVAGAGFALGGFFHGHLGHFEQITAMAWLPWALLAADRAVDAGTPRAAARPAAGLAVALGLTALAGHSQYLHMALATVALYAVAVTPTARRLLAVGAGAAVGLGLAAVQLVPTALAASDSVRAGGLPFGEAAANDVPAGLVVDALLPHFGGEPPVPVEHWGWLAWSILVLAGWGAVTRPARRHVALAVVAAAGALLAVGTATPAFRIAYEVVPGTDLFREPGRWLLLPSLSVPLLAAVGVEAVRRRNRPTPAGKTALAAAAVVAVAALLTRTNLDGLALVAGAAAGAAAVGLVIVAHRRARWAGMAAVMLAALVGAELVGAGATSYAWDLRMEQGSVLDRSAAATAIAAAEAADRRILALGREALDDLPAIRAALRPNTHALDGLRSIDGYDGGLLVTDEWGAAMRDLIRQPGFRPEDTVRAHVGQPLDPRLLAELDVGWVVSHPADLAVGPLLPAGSQREAIVGDVALWRVPTLGPVFLDDGTVPAGLALERDADRPGRLTVTLPGGIGGRTVVVSESMADGWTASGDVDLRRHRDLLMSFTAPADARSVTLSYRTPGLAAGTALTAVSLAAVAAALAWGRRR